MRAVIFANCFFWQYFILQNRTVSLAFHFHSIAARRTIMKKLLVFAALGLLYLLGCSNSFAEQLRDGDIIFQTSRSEQSTAIQKTTHSQYSHMGIVFFRNGSHYVYEAIKMVQYTPLRKWVERGEGGCYVEKRLREADRILTSQTAQRLRKAGAAEWVKCERP
jgi:hypothetical protein